LREREQRNYQREKSGRLLCMKYTRLMQPDKDKSGINGDAKRYGPVNICVLVRLRESTE